jgi:hypothetical protein
LMLSEPGNEQSAIVILVGDSLLATVLARERERERDLLESL